MPLNSVERHEAAETPAHGDCQHQDPVPQTCHRVPYLLLCKAFQITNVTLLFLAKLVVTALAGFPQGAQL